MWGIATRNRAGSIQRKTTMDDKPQDSPRISRRQLLKSVPIGPAGAAAVGMVAGKILGPLLNRRRPPEVPEGSIFTPAKNRDTEA